MTYETKILDSNDSMPKPETADNSSYPTLHTFLMKVREYLVGLPQEDDPTVLGKGTDEGEQSALCRFK